LRYSPQAEGEAAEALEAKAVATSSVPKSAASEPASALLFVPNLLLPISPFSLKRTDHASAVTVVDQGRSHYRRVRAGGSKFLRKERTPVRRGINDHRASPALALERGMAFTVAAALPLYLALRNDGYDIVVRQEFGLVVWWSLALGFAFGVLPRSRSARGSRLTLAALAGLVAWTALSLLWTASDERTFAELARTVTLAGVVVLAWAGLNARTWKAAAAGLSVAAIAVPVIAVASRLVPAAFTLGVLRGFDRLSYPLGYWNAIGAWSAIAVGFGLAFSSHLRDRRLRATSLAGVPIAGVAIYLTYSRSGVIGAAIAALIVIALARHRTTAAAHALAAGLATGAVVLVIRGHGPIAHGTGGAGGAVVALALFAACAVCAEFADATRRRGLDRVRLRGRVTRALAIACAVLVVGGGIAFGPGIVSHAGDQLASGSYPARSGDPSTRLVSVQSPRYGVWESAFDAFGSKPATGVGPGTFEFWWERDAPAGEPLRDAHSLYLESLGELGLPGFALLATFIAGLGAAALRARRRARGTTSVAAATALVAAFAVYLFAAGVDWMWESTGVTVLALGAVCVAGASGQEPRRPRRRLNSPRLLLVALALAAGALQLPGLISTGRVRASTEALAAGRMHQAESLAGQAVEAEPWAATPYAERALVEASAGRLGAGRRDARAAIAREPTNWRHRMLLAWIQVDAGNRRGAERAISALRRLHPGTNPHPAAIRRRIEARTSSRR
jgi:hypothetical protein